MKKVYIFVLLICSISLICLKSTQAQEGFENYDDGAVPGFITDVSASGNTAVEVTSEDKWSGSKSLVRTDDSLSAAADPYFAINLKEPDNGIATFSFDVKVRSPLWFHIVVLDSVGRRGPDLVFLGLYGALGETFFGGAIKTDEGTNMQFPVDSWFHVEINMKTGSAYDHTCSIKLQKLEGDNPISYTRSSFRFHLNPYVANGDSVFNGSLKKAKIFFLADDNTPNRGSGNIYIDNLSVPQSTITTGIEEADQLKCQIYPNPSTGSLTIISPSRLDHIQIFNIDGKAMLKKDNVNPNQFFNLSGLSNGIYFVKMSTKEGTSTQKLILNK